MKTHGAIKVIGAAALIVAVLDFIFASARGSMSGAARAVQTDPVEDSGGSHGSLWLASKAGAALDSDLMKGGGHDDTAVLQRVLDRGKDGQAVQLVIDGPALVSGLTVYGHTTIECVSGGGLFLKDHSDRAVIRNAHRSRDKVVDEHIMLRGCFVNGNRDHQVSVGPSPLGGTDPGWRVVLEVDGTFKAGIEFFGVNYLSIENVTLWNMRSFGAWIANSKFINVNNVIVDNGIPPFPRNASTVEMKDFVKKYSGNVWNDDGLHFNGPIQYLTINGAYLRTTDDGIGLNANDMNSDDLTVRNDMGPYIGQGPITDVIVSNVVFADAWSGIRLLSKNQRVDRILFTNITGTVLERMAVISRYVSSHYSGNFGSIVFSNMNLELGRFPPWPELYGDEYKAMTAQSGWEGYDWGEEGEVPLFSVNGQIESLRLSNIVARVHDSRPLLRMGTSASVRAMTVDLTIADSALRAIPLKLVTGSRVGRLDVSLAWQGATLDRGECPIQGNQGAIGQLNWLNTPPTCAKTAGEKSRMRRLPGSDPGKW